MTVGTLAVGARPAVASDGAGRPGRSWVERAYRRVEHLGDGAFGSAGNPLRHLGALGFWLLWLLVGSGVVLYALLDTSAQGAYRSVEALSTAGYGAGSLLRGLHRYAADGFVLVMLIHLAREWMMGRAGGFRRVTWWTGVPLLLLAFVSGIGGFWLSWDRLGQFSAQSTAAWLDALPVFASPLTRNFLGGASVGDRLFSLFVFIHLGAPLLLVFGLWLHVQRISRADVFPPRRLAVGTVAVLLLLALVVPIRSQGAADLSTVPGPLALDWLLLFVHPLVDATSPVTVWVGLAAVLALLIALPLLQRRPQQPVARVDAANCNGCRRCFDDCPYEAITMVPHPLRRGREVAQVRESACASCGICAGACPSSTPFRSVADLVTGIDMPQLTIDALRRRMNDGLKAMRGGRRFVVFGCAHGARTAALTAPDVLPIELVCAGALPPAFVEYALRSGADGVLIAACREGGCEFRLGERWTADRVAGAREPAMRADVDADRFAFAHVDEGDEVALEAALEQLRRSPRPLPGIVRAGVEA